MARLGPFESAPWLAVGVSGGADSLALALLAGDWARERGGRILALTVDHGLRAGSAQEAAGVGSWLAAHGIAHRILRWEGEKPLSRIQEAARAARHRLLAEACAAEGILHLALAHHRDDQAETVLLRLARGSGIDGLAAMAPVRAEGAVRLIRPLLEVPHDRLVATCRARGQEWVEDPSNRNPAFARARLRAVGSVLAAEGLDAGRLARTARRAARARAALEEAAAALLAVAAEVRPEGWLLLDPRALERAPDEVALRALGTCLRTVGGTAYPPRDEALERLLSDVAEGAGRTLAGCRVLRHRGKLLVAREPELVADRIDIMPGGGVLWDRRFTVRLAPERVAGLTVARLGEDGWRCVVGWRPEARRLALHEAVRASLPGLWDGERLVAAPLPGAGPYAGGPGEPFADAAAFTPRVPLGVPAFTVVSEGRGII
ncbi:tRNA lysidine(34) synthetase TilS [Azospirillum thermophilum]|uniref:tRNA(Ile)-lysidine synthase n=2 Tax=Azospirillum thermophilum TaxID=2202148 RepID=A0A2S2CN29_9PROT|nr:tRNA lysidine(34) synthetase TilS [Azospirillum thermophilum]